MAKKTAPLFRKSMKGYNKDDVNEYILGLNRTLEEQTALHEKEANEYKAKLDEAEKRAKELEELIKKQDAVIASLKARDEEAEKLSGENLEMEQEIISLRVTVSELEESLADYKKAENESSEKAEQYDSICTRAGEILVIASTTAEDILNRANSEATKIVGDANTKKELMLRTFSESVDSAADDINVYIKRAVSDCIDKINASVNEVSRMATDTPVAPAEKRSRAIFINGN